MACPELKDLLEKRSDKNKLGSGKQGTVYKIDDFVLKVVNFPDHESQKQRVIALFKKEKEAIEYLSHHESTKIYLPPLCYIQYDTNHGYIVQKYEKVTPLNTMIKYMKDKNQLWSLKVALPFMENLQKGLDAIHKAGYLHRDLKPENILVRHNNLEIPSFIDFGLACKMKSNGSCDPDVFGTLQFIPTNFIPIKTYRNLLTAKLKVGTETKKVKTSTNTIDLFFTKDTDKYALSIVLEEILAITNWKHKPHHEKTPAELTPEELDSLSKKMELQKIIQQLKAKLIGTLAANKGKNVFTKSMKKSIAKEAASLALEKSIKKNQTKYKSILKAIGEEVATEAKRKTQKNRRASTNS